MTDDQRKDDQSEGGTSWATALVVLGMIVFVIAVTIGSACFTNGWGG